MARVAFVLAEDFEDSEFRVPFDRLQAEGHEVTVVGVKAREPLRGKRGRESATPTMAIDSASADDFDALVIPGGYSPDKLRTNERVVAFTRDFHCGGKPVAAICHAGSLLIEAEAVAGRRLTSWPSIKTDLINAGATWVDEEVVEDGHLITSRKPDDLDAFCRTILRHLGRI
jgi:protease I